MMLVGFTHPTQSFPCEVSVGRTPRVEKKGRQAFRGD